VDFIQRLPFYGMAVLCLDDPQVRSIMPIITKPITTYGTSEGAEIRAVDVHSDDARMRFRVVRQSAPGGVREGADLAITLNLPGMHNVRNALAAIAVGMEVGAPDAAIVTALAEFRGVGRRFERYGDLPLPDGGAFAVIDDYGHHPVEMAATLDAVRGAFPERRIVLVFQPHRYTRTRDCFEDFVKVLSGVDVVLLTEVYPAGEAPIVAADGRALARAVRVQGKTEPIFVEQVSELPSAILSVARPDDVVLIMGAGSIGGVPAKLVAACGVGDGCE
jgi:UDP-N-acetylmuramate--alanine ligase